MNKNVSTYIKINCDMKSSFNNSCLQYGLSCSAAICNFITLAVKNNDFFDVNITGMCDKYEGLLSDDRIHFRISSDLSDAFKNLCSDYGISVSSAIKFFIFDVIENDNLDKYFL